MSFVTLDEHQLEIMLHRAAALAVAELRQDIERNTHPPLPSITDIYIADDMDQMTAAVRTLDDEIQDTDGVQ